MSNSILLVGVGYMGIEYAKVLKSLNCEFIAVGRSETSAKEFKKVIGVKAKIGGIDKYLQEVKEVPKAAIVAVSEDQLGVVTLKIIESGVKTILVEKPGGLDFEDVEKVKKRAEDKEVNVYIGYNRRFYASVAKAKEIIEKDGGILSIVFDFTEAVHKIVPLVRPASVKENWFLQNSTHVIDLAFFLAGKPTKFSSFSTGSLPWHSKAAIFTGAGITEKDVLFAYHADWKGPGRWSLEVVTKNHKLFFKPLEKLQIQKVGTFEVSDVQLDDKLDINFKPGIYREVQSFLGNKQSFSTNKKGLCTISEQVENLKFYKQILEGKNKL